MASLGQNAKKEIFTVNSAKTEKTSKWSLGPSETGGILRKKV